MKLLKLIISIAIFSSAVVLCGDIIFKSRAHQQDKIDYAEINHIKYGLFSINRWKEELSVIIVDEINKLSLTKTTNDLQLKKHIEGQLDVLIDKVDKQVKDSNKKTAKGRLKQFFINAFVDVKDIKAGIPEYADAIVLEMTKAETERQLKDVVKKRIDQYFDKTFEVQDLSKLNRILEKMSITDIDIARTTLKEKVETNQKLINKKAGVFIALAVLLFLIIGLPKQPLPSSQYFLLLLTLVLLLIAGVKIPMIDMEAKISEMSFVLLDHPISFLNQVLYFQSKSILDVFWIMITHKDMQMKAVGILMIMFSIFLPVLKMISSIGYFYNYREAQKSRWIQFFVLKSGKWSMADVLVVAIFMAYVGFNGIITSQFGNFNSTDQDIVILTTNGTSLQPGFYIFLTYTLLALFLSGFLTRKSKPD